MFATVSTPIGQPKVFIPTLIMPPGGLFSYMSTPELFNGSAPAVDAFSANDPKKYGGPSKSGKPTLHASQCFQRRLPEGGTIDRGETP